MKVLEVKTLDECVDGEALQEWKLSSPVSRELIFFLREYGNLMYFEHFVKPFFNIEIQDKCLIKGIEGKEEIEVTLFGGEEKHREVSNLVKNLFEAFD